MSAPENAGLFVTGFHSSIFARKAPDKNIDLIVSGRLLHNAMDRFSRSITFRVSAKTLLPGRVGFVRIRSALFSHSTETRHTSSLPSGQCNTRTPAHVAPHSHCIAAKFVQVEIYAGAII
jgi:hypothetical protein